MAEVGLAFPTFDLKSQCCLSKFSQSHTQRKTLHFETRTNLELKPNYSLSAI